MPYKFIKERDLENRFDNVRVEHVMEGGVSLPDVMAAFEDFLRGCGFNFEGHVDIVEDDLPIPAEASEEKEIPDAEEDEDYQETRSDSWENEEQDGNRLLPQGHDL